MKLVKTYLHKSLVLIMGIALGIVIPAIVFAQSPLKQGLSDTRGKAGLASGSVEGVVGNIFDTVLSLVGILFFGLTIYGGVMWILSRGNEEMAKKALSTVVSAIIGLIIVLASFAITTFIFDSVEAPAGVDLGPAGKCVEGFAFEGACTPTCQGGTVCFNGECVTSAALNALEDCFVNDPNACAANAGTCLEI